MDAIIRSLKPDFIFSLAGLLSHVESLKNPKKDKPLPWMLFAFGYGISIFAITNHTFSNYSLPVFMLVVPALVWWPLLKYRIKNNIPIKYWI